MNIKIILSVFAVIAALTFTAFKSKEKNYASLYWYQVTYDVNHPNGYIPNSNSFYVQSEKSQVSSPCDAGTASDCLRGFTSQLSSFPSSLTGTDQIKKP